MVDGRGGEGCGEKREAWKILEDIRDRGEQPHRLNVHVWPEEEGSQECGGWSTEEEMCRTLDECGGTKMIFKMPPDRTEDGRDVKGGAVTKDNNGKRIT